MRKHEVDFVKVTDEIFHDLHLQGFAKLSNLLEKTWEWLEIFGLKFYVVL